MRQTFSYPPAVLEKLAVADVERFHEGAYEVVTRQWVRDKDGRNVLKIGVEWKTAPTESEKAITEEPMRGYY